MTAEYHSIQNGQADLQAGNADNQTSIEKHDGDVQKSPKREKPLMEWVTTYAKYIISSAATMIYLIYIFWGIWTNEAVLPAHPVAHFIIFCFCMCLVAYLEGLQVSILAAVDKKEDPEIYKDSHPRAYKLMKSALDGKNVDRFLVGRQFFTIFVMTLIGQVTTFPNISQLGIPPVVWFIFIQTGLPAAVVVTTIGSLQPQLLAAKDPWLFMDLYGSYSVLMLCYGLEFTGITHFAYLLTNLIKSTIFISPNKSTEAPPQLSTSEMVKEGVRYFLSFGVLFTYCAYLMWGIWTGQAVLPVPPVAVFIIFVLAGTFLAHLEGIQVAILLSETKDLEVYRESHPRAYAMMKRATHEKNVRRFLVGRQFFVIFVVYLINQCTIFPKISNLGINPGVWLFFIQLGWPIAINVLIWYQLPTQLLATLDAMKFMNRYLPRTTLEVCLFTEMTGVAHFSWVISAISRYTWFYRTPSKDVVSKEKELELQRIDSAVNVI